MTGWPPKSQNRWPSFNFDVGAINGLASKMFVAGFYYKTFMWPAKFWEKVYEPIIRKAAGLGRPRRKPTPTNMRRPMRIATCWSSAPAPRV